MILIDRAKLIQSILLTLDGIAGHSGLKLQHDATRQKIEIDLGENVSPYTDRYDLFRVSTLAFAELPEGFYSYTVTDYFGLLIESGKLLIKPIEAEAIPAVTTTNDYLVFNKKQ